MVVNQVLEPGRRATTSSPAPPAASRCRRRATRTPPGRAATSTPTSRTPPRRSPASRPRSAPCTSAASSRSAVKFIAFGGDGGTYDIGLQALSGAMERGHDMLYVCYDNGGYMNTGFQRSSATPHGAWTTTSPVGEESPGKLGHSKNLTEIMVAHRLPYVAQSSPHDPQDLMHKASKALEIEGPTFLNVLSACPRGWRTENDEGVDAHAPRHRDLLLAAVRGQQGRVPAHLPAAAQAAAGQVAGAPGPLRPPGAPRQRAHCWRRSRSGSTSSGTCCCASATRSPRSSGTRRAAATRPSRS